ncbi:carbohydrate kinase-like protein [Grosmannia clavigera kw1407]|uniref:ATP-dependent (S)-NAD(P)H-hydrate dehydratase n=1 Tax=Grosmannia clavigera (strain kw1407 / UAMH 11150) TaxID=655863 RepID=F0XS01_GROCL|nr:carbohydrate kinase-like protein [Grosmannia clavigera kw1407]EFW99453.1 carbohydrate kinase-like protein [Grosmannia clavigera kw1407]
MSSAASPRPSPPSEMSLITREILSRARKMVPPMLERFHKGQLGRVGVIGGSEDYTGAPYFSAMASARLGCDMSHIICTPAAAAVIKTYSPNLMVHPLMQQSADATSTATAPSDEETGRQADVISARVIAQMLPRLHVLVVGPGLGRDPLMQATAARIVAAARNCGLPLVLDADALRLVQSRPALVRGYSLAVLTPNIVEFGRLEKSLGEEDGGESKDGSAQTTSTDRAARLARILGGVTIVQKGSVDVITSGTPSSTMVSDLSGGRKRSGGQGDTLTGAIATFLAWRKAYLDGLWEEEGAGSKTQLGEQESVLLATFGGSAITRECSRLAFAKMGRSLQASDLTDEVHTAFLNLFGGEEDKPVAEDEAKL